jgi:hypothetical protein
MYQSLISLMSGSGAAGGGGLDSDAQAFLTAISNSDPTIESAINQLVLDLKAASIWTKMQGIYPFVGGSATSHKYNLKDPQDTDAAFRLTFSGTVTHNANGITGNGTTGYADTHYNLSTHGTLNSQHISIYSRTGTNETNNDVDIGGRDGTNVVRLDIASFSTAQGFNQASALNTVANTSGLGFFVNSRTASTGYRIQIRGTNNNITRTSSAKPSASLYIAALNNNGSATAFSARNFAFASVGTGLTQTEAADFDTAVVTFQTTLGRNV